MSGARILLVEDEALLRLATEADGIEVLTKRAEKR